MIINDFKVIIVLSNHILYGQDVKFTQYIIPGCVCVGYCG